MDWWMAMMGPDMYKMLLFNKNSKDERLCPGCMTLYNPLPKREGKLRVHEEQRLSGICSLQCWVKLNGPGGFDAQEWLGSAADSVQIVMQGSNIVMAQMTKKQDG